MSKRKKMYVDQSRQPLPGMPVCPACGGPAEGWTGIADEPGLGGPKPGYICVCGYCGAFNTYTETLQLRRATDEELRLLKASPALSRLTATAAKLALEWRRKQKL